MIIEICSRKRAEELISQTQTDTAVISITSTDEEDAKLPCNPHVQTVLRLKLNDITSDFDEEGIPYGRPVPQQEDLNGLRKFVDGLSCSRLIIHCYEGRSRSAAVADAVLLYRNAGDTVSFEQEPVPNPLILMLARRELGI